MVYESVVGEASGGIDFVLVLFPCFIQIHGGYHPSAFGKSERAGLAWRMVILLERSKHPASTVKFC